MLDSRSRSLACSLVLGVSVSCGGGSPASLTGSETGDGTSDNGDGDGDANVTFDAVSILLVVDNSGSMAEKQVSLATAAVDLVAPLDLAGIPWRLGITTTDNGNPWCPPETTSPEAGELVLSPCTARAEDFDIIDEYPGLEIACLSVCTNDDFQIVPTTTALDPNPSQRPWIESNGSQTNIDGASVEEALRCLVPQGMRGCGFESQLYSSYLTLAHARNADKAEYGFVHGGRLLVVVHVTDEADCSHNEDWSEIFEQDGNRTFWSDPSTEFPTSAVCWNAGMQCTGDPSNYDSCEPAELDVNGDLTDDPDLAVLVPVDQIIAGMGDPNAVLVFGIVGVQADGSVHYSDVSDTDPAYQASFGIGPGCTAPPPLGQVEPVTAVPPGRILTVIEQLGPSSSQAAFSICDSSFSSAFVTIGDAIAAKF